MPVITLAKENKALTNWEEFPRVSGCLPTQSAAAMIVLIAVRTSVLANTERYTYSSSCRPGRDLPPRNMF